MAYDDKDMFHDKDFNQYILNASYPMNRIAMDENMVSALKRNDYLDKLLFEVSDDVYGYIKNYSTPHTYKYKLEKINNEEEERQIIKRAMLYQVRYYIRSGGGLLKDMTGVDLQKSKVLDIQALRGQRHIAKQTIDELSKSEYLLKTQKKILGSRFDVYDE